MNVTYGYNEHVKEIIENEKKAKEFDDIKNKLCNTCKYNRVIMLTSIPPQNISECTLFNVKGMKFCSKWESNYLKF